LVFIKKFLKQKDIYFRIYLEQVLEPIVFLLFEIFGSDYIYIENRFKIYKEKARLPRLEHGIHNFN
jgi:hypothetical protein